MGKFPAHPCRMCGTSTTNRLVCGKPCAGKLKTLNALIQCKVCGKTFKPQRRRTNNPQCCSKICSGLAQRTRVSLTCAVCGKGFEIKASHAATARFCSKQCKDSWLPMNKPTHICTYCGSSFTSKFGHKRRTQHCSRECYQAERCALADKITCEHCGKEFINPGNPNPRFCSRSCFWQHRGPTSIETAVANLLIALGTDFAREFPLSGYEFDFIVPSVRLLIECDGDYWHSFPEAKNRDRIKTNSAIKQGYRVLRLSETLIESDPAKCRRLIVNELKRSGQLPLPARYTLV